MTKRVTTTIPRSFEDPRVKHGYSTATCACRRRDFGSRGDGEFCGEASQFGMHFQTELPVQPHRFVGVEL